MAKKQFKAESKRLLDLMINSIYTHKEIFLREIISNASDAIDKLYYKCLTEENTGINRDDFYIRITPNRDARTLVISDNGIGMTKEEMENNLGTIAKSGSLQFKQEHGAASDSNKGCGCHEGDCHCGEKDCDCEGTDVEKDEAVGPNGGMDIDIIGQFGVGFYSAFMVSKNIQVISKTYGSEQAYMWESQGADGYTMKECEKGEVGTDVILTLKDDTEDDKFGEYVSEYKIKQLVKHYSDYVRYPIKMNCEQHKMKEATEEQKADENYKPEYETFFEEEVLNSMVPIWKKSKKDITNEEYNEFYKDKFYDFVDPVKVIHTSVEGASTYNALLYIPGKAPYNYYTKEYEKGLQLYSSGVLIMEKCGDLLPDYFSFVRGLVDSQDLSLNISREMLQHNRQLKAIEIRLEKKIKSELLEMLEKDREKYDEFFKNFGLQLKFGLYDSYGMNKEKIQDLVMFYSSSEKKMATFAEYVSRMKDEQKYIYYACGASVEKLDKQPQTEVLKEKEYEIFYCTDEIDEFALKVMREYNGKEFRSVSDEDLGIEETEEEKKASEKQNEDSKEVLQALKEVLGGKVSEVRLSTRLKNHPVCFATGGNISIEMEKVLNNIPTGEKVKAEKVLEINGEHQVFKALKSAFGESRCCDEGCTSTADVKDDETLNENEKTEAACQDSKYAGTKLEKYAKLLYNQALLIEGMAVEDPIELSNLICELM